MASGRRYVAFTSAQINEANISVARSMLQRRTSSSVSVSTDRMMAARLFRSPAAQRSGTAREDELPPDESSAQRIMRTRGRLDVGSSPERPPAAAPWPGTRDTPCAHVRSPHHVSRRAEDCPPDHQHRRVATRPFALEQNKKPPCDEA